MTQSGATFAATKPIAVWNRALKVDFKDLFKSLSKATAAGLLGNPALAVAGALDALSAVKLEGDPPGLTWLLIRRSLTKATSILWWRSETASSPMAAKLTALLIGLTSRSKKAS